MPKIGQIARFTTPVKLPVFSSTNLETNETTPVKNKTLPEILKKLNEERHATRETLLEYVELVLTELDQPVTTYELSVKLSNDLGKKYDPNSVRLLLKDLLLMKKVAYRVESSDERRVRADGKKVRNLVATLWWAPFGEVPARTVCEVVPGVILTDESGKKPGSIVKHKNITKKIFLDRENAEAVASDTPSSLDAGSLSGNTVVSYLVDRLVEERSAGLRQELEDTKAELEALKKIIRSAVVDKL